MWLGRITCLLVLAVAASAQAQPKLSFKSRELQEGKNSLSKLTAVLAVGEAVGELSYRYAIEVPAGRGVTPEIALDYSSHSGHSEYGWGWNLTVPSIERSDKNGVGATAPLGFQQPMFRFRNGNQTIDLIRVGTPSSGWEVWRERRESTFARYLRNSATNTWRVLRSDGVRLDLGLSTDSRRGTQTGHEPSTDVWQVDTITDTHGNYARYSYDPTDGLINSIQYNGNSALRLAPTMSVRFEWGNIPTSVLRINYRAGFPRYAGKRTLDAIVVSVPRHATTNAALVPASSPTTRRYTFTYRSPSQFDNMYYLISAQQESFPPVTFEYSEPGPRAGLVDNQRVFGSNDISFPRDLGYSQVSPATGQPEWTRTRRVLVDVTRDGRADLLEATGNGNFILWRNVGTSTLVRESWKAPLVTLGLPSPEAGALRVTVINATARKLHSVSTSLPGSSTLDRSANVVDIFTGQVNTAKPHIIFLPQ